MNWKRTVLLASFLTLTLGSCTSIEVKPDLPCPLRPVLTPIPEDLQMRMPEDAIWIVAQNQLAMKEYAKKLEARSNCADNTP